MSDTEVTPRVNARKTREGLVVSTKMDKTIIVAVTDRVRHPRYRKTLQRTTRLYAHDGVNDAEAPLSADWIGVVGAARA